MRKKRRKFSKEIKRAAVEDYRTGAKSAQTIASELDVEVKVIYRWKTAFEESAKGNKIEEFVDNGMSPDMAKRMLLLETEVEMYQKKLAEVTIINDLLKKLLSQGPLPPESELSGLIATTLKSARKRKLVK